MPPWSWLIPAADGGGRFPLPARLLGLAAVGLIVPASVPAVTASAPVPTAPEVAAVAKVVEPPGSVPAAADGRVADPWVPPTSGAILRRFDPPSEPWAAGHRGVDWEATGTEVVAPGSGTVRFAGPVAGRPVITIAHANGMLSSLEPVTAADHWSVGDRVEAGELLGTVGQGEADGGEAAGGTPVPGPGHCAQRCVHWGVRIPDGWVVDGAAWDRYLDPLVLLGWSGPSILWPLEGGPPR